MKGRCLLVMIIVMVLVAESQQQAQTCGNNATPKSAEDCISGSNEQSLCCFIQSPGFNPIEKKCVPFEKSKYHGQREYYTVSALEMLNVYRMDCGEVEFSQEKGQLCGNDQVYNPADCWAFSTASKSCCSNLDKTKCIWYKKKPGNITDDESIESLICSAKHAQLKKVLIALTLIMIIFI